MSDALRSPTNEHVPHPDPVAASKLQRYFARLSSEAVSEQKGDPLFAAFAFDVVTLFEAALQETDVPVTQEQMLLCIDTQGQSFKIEACSDPVRERLAVVRGHNREWYQKMMVEARVQLLRMNQDNWF